MDQAITQIADGVFRIADTCQVYVIRSGGPGSTGIAVDFGSGRLLELLPELGVSRLTHVLMTHHHRDQGQGLARATAAGVEIWVPPVEVELFTDADAFWQTRRVWNDYEMRSDRQALLEPVQVSGTVPEYRTRDFGGIDVRTRPTPGHTTGSVSYLVHRDGQLLAFTGDLIYAPGKVWSMMPTQWTYNGSEGPAMTMISALRLRQERPDLLLPSHGRVITDPDAALALLFDRMQAYVDSRRPEGSMDIANRLDNPFREITEHLLVNTSSESKSYVLLSDQAVGNGRAALVFDYGYDMTDWYPLGGVRASQRPWLESVPALREHYRVERVEVAIPTHYHDDHVAGLNLLREVEGTQLWIPENVAPIMAAPLQYDLPCQWFDPIAADRVLPLDRPVQWREYSIAVHPLPGHTRYAAAFAFEVDQVRVLVTGDQQDSLGRPGRRDLLNYQYRNQLELGDYRHSAELYHRIGPGLMITGHLEPRWVDPGLLDQLTVAGRELDELHRALLPLDELELPLTGQLARLVPYWQTASAGESLSYRIELTNPYPTPVGVTAAMVVPSGWVCEPPLALSLPAAGTCEAKFDLTVGAGATPRRTAVVAVELTVGELLLGQHTEALVRITGSQT